MGIRDLISTMIDPGKMDIMRILFMENMSIQRALRLRRLYTMRQLLYMSK